MSVSRRRLGAWLAGGAAGVALGGFRVPLAQAAEANGKLLVVVQAQGGWDVTSFCDPKANVHAVPVNHWADAGEIQTAGNIPYAPIGGNQTFFDKYASRTLVINGVDAQTNSHDTGVLHNWSGRISEGFPSITALYSAAVAPTAPMSYLSFGGFSATGGVARFTRVDDPALILNITFPQQQSWDDEGRWITDDDWDRVQSFHSRRLALLADNARATPRAKRFRALFESARDHSADLADFAALVPPTEELEAPVRIGGKRATLRRQAQVALVAMQAGVSVCADLHMNGFDSHANSEPQQTSLLSLLTDGIDYLWDEAERRGLADRLVVVVASDFSRTPWYNDGDGKDHHPIGSVVVMEKNQSWTNRVVGGTTDADGDPFGGEQHLRHQPLSVNPATLARDDSDTGTIIYPKHIHRALRSYLGIADAPTTGGFALDTEDLPFFST